MYNPVFWKDRIVQYPRRVSVQDISPGVKEWTPAPGEIEQVGTAQSERNFGNMDFGILENSLMVAHFMEGLRIVMDQAADNTGQYFDVTLKNTFPFPASNAEQTVTLPHVLNNLDYEVHPEIKNQDGYVDRVEVYGKALNAFKVKYYGSAKQVTLRLHVVGGVF